MKRVTMKVADRYSIPTECVSCGAPTGKAGIALSKKQGNKTLTVRFAVCDACDKASRRGLGVQRNYAIGLALVGAVGLSLLLVGLGYVVTGIEGWSCAGAVVGGVIGLIAGKRLGASSASRSLSSDEWDRYQRLHFGSVGIVGFKTGFLATLADEAVVEFAFANDSYADTFVAANPALVASGDG
jgi:hypothetical protein